MLTDDVLAVTVTVGTRTVTAVLAVALAAPLAAVRMMVPAAAGAVVAATTVTVAVLPGFTLAGLMLTATPEGAVAERLIRFVNPLVPPTVTVYVAD